MMSWAAMLWAPAVEAADIDAGECPLGLTTEELLDVAAPLFPSTLYSDSSVRVDDDLTMAIRVVRDGDPRADAIDGQLQIVLPVAFAGTVTYRKGLRVEVLFLRTRSP
jgi:hypothetical protein